MSADASRRSVVTVHDEALAERCRQGRVVIIDDEPRVLESFRDLLELEGYACETYPSAAAYLKVLAFNRPCFPGPVCVLCDVRMPELDGLELQQRLAAFDDTPILLMSGAHNVNDAVDAFRQGALDFLVKPMAPESLLDAVAKALRVSADRQVLRQRQARLAAGVARLTAREREVGRRVAGGDTNAEIAQALGISLRSVKRHRQSALDKLGAETTAEFARLAYEAGL